MTALICGLAGAVGYLLPWVSILGFGISGLKVLEKDPLCAIGILGALFAIILAGARIASPRSAPGGLYGIAGALLMAAPIVIWAKMAHGAGKEKAAGELMANVSISSFFGIGFWLVLIAGILVAACGFISFAMSKRTPVRQNVLIVRR